MTEELFYNYATERFRTETDANYTLCLSLDEYKQALIEHDKEIRDKIKKINKKGRYYQEVFQSLDNYDVWSLLDNQQKEILTEAINIGVEEVIGNLLTELLNWLKEK